MLSCKNRPTNGAGLEARIHAACKSWFQFPAPPPLWTVERGRARLTEVGMQRVLRRHVFL